jgi:hypothetical protein
VRVPDWLVTLEFNECSNGVGVLAMTRMGE